VEPKDFVGPTSFCYEGTNIVSVNLGVEDYQTIGVKVPGSIEQQSAKKPKRRSYLNTRSLIEDDLDICSYKPCDSLDELRFIYSWKKIPPQYFHPDSQSIPEDSLKEWILENLPSSKDTGNENKQSIVNFVMKQLIKPTNPDDLVQTLLPVTKKKTCEFVLKVWKFLCAKTLCHQKQIPEHTRNEFDHYSSASIKALKDSKEAKQKPPDEEVVDSLSLLPNEWSFFEMNREQRLKIYEKAIEAGKILSDDECVKFDEIKAQTEEQMKVIEQFESDDKDEKTHLQVMAELRDYKRRRQTYRGKNKQSRKLTGVEVLRELVDQQMLYLEIIRQTKKRQEEATKEMKIKEENNQDDRSKERGRSRSQERGRSRSQERSRRRSRSRSQHSRETSKSRSSSTRRREYSKQDSREYSSSRRRDGSRDSRYSKNHRRKSRSRSRERSRHERRRRSDSRERKRDRGSKRHDRDEKELEISNVTYYD